ncbi:MAG: hypothetical protein C4291_04100 [Candidatus Dadabacteria bacterium]
MYRYQLFPYIVEKIKLFASDNKEKTDILIPAYRSKRLIHQFKYVADRILHGDFADVFNTYFNKFKYINWERKNERVM